MAFEAGAIRGKIDLDTTGYKRGLDEAHTHASDKGSKIREVFESVNASLSELSPSLAEVGEKMNSVFAGFSEGKVLGTFNAAMIGLGALREVTAETGERFDEMDLAAQRAGVSVEWLSTMAGVGERMGVGVDQLTMSFRMLEQSAAEAVEQTGEARRAFERLHISTAELSTLMENPEELFDRVRVAIQGEANAALRAQMAHDLLGRSGQMLIPLMRMNAAEFDNAAQSVRDFHAVISDSDAALGHTSAELKSEFSELGTGIGNALGRSILQSLQGHKDEIKAWMLDLQKTVIGLPKDWDYLHGPQAMRHVANAIQAVRTSPWVTESPDEDRALGFMSATNELGYNPLGKFGVASDVAQPVPANLMPHWRDPLWKNGADTPTGLATIIEHQLVQEQPALQHVLADLNLHTSAGPGLNVPSLPTINAELHQVMTAFQPTMDRGLDLSASGATGPEVGAAVSHLNEFSNALLSASARLHELAPPSSAGTTWAGVAVPAINALFEPSISAFANLAGTLDVAMGPVLTRMRELIDLAANFHRGGLASSPIYGPPNPASQLGGQPIGSAAGTTINANINTSIDANATANMIAGRIRAPLTAAIQRQQRAIVGAAQQAIAQQTIGGGS